MEWGIVPLVLLGAAALWIAKRTGSRFRKSKVISMISRFFGKIWAGIRATARGIIGLIMLLVLLVWRRRK